MKFAFWALAALSFVACTGGNGPGPDGGPSDGNDSTDTDTPAPGTGGLNVNATFNGSNETCTVNTVDGEELGETGFDILDLDPGPLEIQLGLLTKTTLDGVPLHVSSTDKYLFGGASVTIVEGEITPVNVALTEAPQYHCESHQCDWPYEGGSCDFLLDEEDQWIYVAEDGVLHGSEKDSFGGQSPGVVSLVGGTLSIAPNDGNEVLDASFDEGELSFSYTYTNDAFEITGQVTCSLK